MPARRAGAGSREPTGLTRPGVRREAPARACRSRARGLDGEAPARALPTIQAGRAGVSVSHRGQVGRGARAAMERRPRGDSVLLGHALNGHVLTWEDSGWNVQQGGPRSQVGRGARAGHGEAPARTGTRRPRGDSVLLDHALVGTCWPAEAPARDTERRPRGLGRGARAAMERRPRGDLVLLGHALEGMC